MNEDGVRLAVAAIFLEPNLAHLARLRLEAEGVQALLDGEHHVAMDWLISNAIGGVKLVVRERDLALATRILQSDPPEIGEEQMADEVDSGERLARCPACDSTEVYRERLKRRLVCLSILLLGIPIPILSRRMVCEACGHGWPAR